MKVYISRSSFHYIFHKVHLNSCGYPSDSNIWLHLCIVDQMDLLNTVAQKNFRVKCMLLENNGIKIEKASARMFSSLYFLQLYYATS